MKLPWSFWLELVLEALVALWTTLSWLAFVVVVAIAIGECAAGEPPEFEGIPEENGLGSSDGRAPVSKSGSRGFDSRPGRQSTQENPPRVYGCECDEVP